MPTTRENSSPPPPTSDQQIKVDDLVYVDLNNAEHRFQLFKRLSRIRAFVQDAFRQHAIAPPWLFVAQSKLLMRFMEWRKRLSELDINSRAYEWMHNDPLRGEKRFTLDFIFFETLMLFERYVFESKCRTENITHLSLASAFVGVDVDFLSANTAITHANLLTMDFQQLLETFNFVISRFWGCSFGQQLVVLTRTFMALFAKFRFTPHLVEGAADTTWLIAYSSTPVSPPSPDVMCTSVDEPDDVPKPQTYITNIDFTHWLMFTLSDVWLHRSHALPMTPFEYSNYDKKQDRALCVSILSEARLSDMQERLMCKTFVSFFIRPGDKEYFSYKFPNQSSTIPENVIEHLRGEKAISDIRMRAQDEYRTFLFRTDLTFAELRLQCQLFVHLLSAITSLSYIDVTKEAYFDLYHTPLSDLLKIQPTDPVFVFAGNRFCVYYNRTFYDTQNDFAIAFKLWVDFLSNSNRKSYLNRDIKPVMAVIRRHSQALLHPREDAPLEPPSQRLRLASDVASTMSASPSTTSLEMQSSSSRSSVSIGMDMST